MTEQETPRELQGFKALLLDAQVFGVEGFGRLRPGAVAASQEEPTADTLLRIATEAEACRKCALGSSRQRCVPGIGARHPDYVFVGDTPGADEERQGEPFVDAAGALLDRMIVAMGLTRESVYITNVLKCRPPDSREPARDEVVACHPFLRREIDFLRPKVVIALGAHAAWSLLGTDETVQVLRGRVHDVGGSACVVTYHPADLLRAPQEKARAWDDLKFALSLTGRVPPTRA